MYAVNFGLVLLAVTTSQHWSPPHYVMGYSLTEWLTLLSILTIFIGLLSYLVKLMIFSPLSSDIKRLSDRIDDTNRQRAREEHEIRDVIKQHTELLNRHDDMLIRHDDYIKFQKEERNR